MFYKSCWADHGLVDSGSSDSQQGLSTHHIMVLGLISCQARVREDCRDFDFKDRARGMRNPTPFLSTLVCEDPTVRPVQHS